MSTMLRELRIVGTPIRTDLKLNELPRFLAEQAPDLVVYEWRPIPGRIMGAAFDWVAILGTTADLLAIGGALWATYEHLIKKRKKPSDAKPPAFLIQVKARNETFVQLMIEEGTEREEFIQEFTQVVSSLRVSSNVEATESAVEIYESSESHVRVRPRRDS